MKSSIPRIIGCDMIENQTSYVNKMFDLKYEYNPILVESGVISAGDWRSLGRRLAFSRPAIDVLYKGDRHYCLCFHLMPIICPCHFTPADGQEMV